MGATLSPDVYQYKVDKIFQDIPQCVGIADDIMIFGYNDQDHDATLYSVLDRACDVGCSTLINVHSKEIASVFMV